MECKPEILREVLMWCEKNLGVNTRVMSKDIQIEGLTSEQIIYHSILLVGAGYIEGKRVASFEFNDVWLVRLTLDGHQFYDTLKSDTTWKHLKEYLEKMGLQAFPEIVKYLLPIIVAHLGL